jgi:hypothetical protein
MATRLSCVKRLAVLLAVRQDILTALHTVALEHSAHLEAKRAATGCSTLL